MIAIFAIAFLAVAILPQVWVGWTIRRHSAARSDLPGTGGELARHLLNRFDLAHVKVEITDKGDHYDPDDKAVRLLKQHHDGRSLNDVLRNLNGERRGAFLHDLHVFRGGTEIVVVASVLRSHDTLACFRK